MTQQETHTGLKKPLLEVTGLNKTYPGGGKALVDFSLKLEKGERVVLIGPNGSGKTTLIKCIMGLVLPDSGSISINGVDVLKEPGYARAHIPVVFEEANNSYAYLTAFQNLMYFGLLNGFSRSEVRKKAAELLQLVGLTGQRDTLVQTFSRGMKQRLALAIAFMKEGPLVFLDEPTLGLDIESQHQMRELLSSGEGRWESLLLTTHDVPFAHAVGTRISVIKAGKMAWQGLAGEVPSPELLQERLFEELRRPG